jgi:hypothetical protein
MAGGAERRRYKRYEIELPGQVRSGEGERRGCMVCDYCSGGMLARRASMDASAEGAVYRPGQHLDIELRLLTGDGSRAVRVNGNVAWIKGEYFGLSFAKSSDVVVEALKQHHRLAHTGTGASFARQANSGVIDPDQLHQAARDSLLGLMQELLTLCWRPWRDNWNGSRGPRC